MWLDFYFCFDVQQLDQTDFGLAQPFLLKGIDNKVVSAYNSFQIDMAVLYGADQKRAEEDMKDALDFEIKLAKVGGFSDWKVFFTLLFH